MLGQSPPDPGRYGTEIAIMREMGWSWQDLCEAPPDLVEEIAVRTAAQAHWQGKRDKQKAQLDKAHKGR